MNERVKLKRIREYAFQIFHDDVTGHDYYHMERVARTAKQIAIEEKANLFICEAAALLHDVGDAKLFEQPEKNVKAMNLFLKSIELTAEQIKFLNQIIKEVSFSRGVQVPATIEGRIVQDADRIDAIGAIGIARTFAYGGANQQMIHHNTEKSTSIQHFYDKLLKLYDLLHTTKAKEMAISRQRFMEQYLEQFYKEW
ncbi:HD domain-containing protein [Oceanobacillus chungangensis]|uniref:Metal-dependent phosphohydrolase n=1 Tax=Oceanobacillus chungangensis TaxID=1229152 RepID=A0A3D8Q2X9_9BACI|nr:HD domain-containing protein [Oceanobacillus chungangensis]RDW22078.1 metal-dependent phosphohydrolase [Oceanobacillus chungangensis]